MAIEAMALSASVAETSTDVAVPATVVTAAGRRRPARPGRRHPASRSTEMLSMPTHSSEAGGVGRDDADLDDGLVVGRRRAA